MSTGDKDTSSVLAELQHKGEEFAKKIVVEKKRLKDLSDAIAHITTETEKFRAHAKKYAIKCLNKNILTPNPAFQRADGVNVGREAENQTRKSIVTLEATLNRQLQRRSEVDILNAKIKQDINHMRLVRIQTDSQQKKFEALLYETKEKIEKLMGESAAVIEERDRLVEMKESLELQNVEEQKIFEEEFEDLGKYIKEQNQALETALLHDRKDDSDKTLDTVMPAANFEEEDRMADKVGTLSNFVKHEHSAAEDISKRIKEYEGMFEELKMMTNTNSLEELIKSYSTNEEEMFSIYSYIQSMNAETDFILEATQKLTAEIEMYKTEQTKHLEAEDRVRTDLEGKVQVVDSQLEVVQEGHKVQADGVDQISKKVLSMFFKLQCDQIDSQAKQSSSQKGKAVTVSKPDNKVQLLTGQGISEANALDYMGIIEQRAVDIISSYIRDHHKEGAVSSPTPGPPTPMHMNFTAPLFDVREFNEDEWVEDDVGDGRPLDMNTFKKTMDKRHMSNHQKRESKSEKGAGHRESFDVTGE